MPAPTDLIQSSVRFDLLQAGLDHLEQGITVFDDALRLVAANRTFFSMLEFPDSLAAPGTPFEAFMRFNAERGEYGAGDVDVLVAERMARARAFASHYTERLRPNGRLIAIRGEPVPQRGFVTLYTDITDRRRAEALINERQQDLEARVRERTVQLEAAYGRLQRVNRINEQIAAALRRNEERLRLITDAVPAWIAAFDRDRIYRFANRGYAEWFGHSKSGVVGQPIEAILGPHVMAQIGEYIDRSLAGETVSYEYTVVRGKAVRHARSTLVPDVDAAGQVQGVFVLSFDVTDERLAEAGRLQARKMEAVGQFAGGIAHDLNNLLTVVLGNLSALAAQSSGRPESPDAALQPLLQPALRATRSGVELLRRLMAFARRQQLDPHAVDISDQLDTIVELARTSIGADIDIAIDARAPATVWIDTASFEAALLNLLFNAADAMPEGGRIVVGMERVRIDGSTPAPDLVAADRLPPGEYIVVAVRDSGAGMDPATLQRACEPFFTTRTQRNHRGAGTGLGLPTVYGFGRQSGGGLQLESAPGAGTMAAIWLPVAARVECPPEAPGVGGSLAAVPHALGASAATVLPSAGTDVTPEGRPLKSLLVLLVDDEPEVRRVLRRQLLHLGANVIEASGCSEALTLLTAVAGIRLVLTDVRMQGPMDGIDLALQIRREWPEVALLLVSGHAAALDPARVAGLAMLQKPVSEAALLAAVQAAAVPLHPPIPAPVDSASGQGGGA